SKSSAGGFRLRPKPLFTPNTDGNRSAITYMAIEYTAPNLSTVNGWIAVTNWDKGLNINGIIRPLVLYTTASPLSSAADIMASMLAPIGCPIVSSAAMTGELTCDTMAGIERVVKPMIIVSFKDQLLMSAVNDCMDAMLTICETEMRQSMDRFGDDLCQLLLSYLSLEERFRYEEVSKQWQRRSHSESLQK
ncbi:unnamed protein product, partial [Medioppia subpectinata]